MEYKIRPLGNVPAKDYIAGARLRFSERASHQILRAYKHRKEVVVHGNFLLGEGFGRWLEKQPLLFQTDRPPLRVLDIGIGGGALTSLFILNRILESGRIPHLTLLDVTLETLQVTRGLKFDIPPGMLEEYRLTEAHRDFFPRALYIMADATRLPFADGVFDAVVSGFTHHHIKGKGLAASEMQRVVRRGGFVGVVDFYPTRGEEKEYHARNRKEGISWVPESFLPLSQHVRLFTKTEIAEKKRLHESHLFWGMRK